MYQPQGPIGTLYVDKFTGSSQYQGFFIRPQFHITAAYLSRVDLSYEEYGKKEEEAKARKEGRLPTDLLSFGVVNGKSEAEPIYPVYLNQVYVTPRPGETLAKDCVWPKEGLKREGVDVGAEEFKLDGRNAVRGRPRPKSTAT